MSLDPFLCLVEVEEGRRMRGVDPPKASFQEPATYFILVFVGQLHKNCHKEAIGEHKSAFSVVAACGNMYTL